MRGARGRWFVTPHAVHRFRQRVPGGAAMSFETAQAAIVADSLRAHHVRSYADGSELWRAGRPLRTRYIVRPQSNGLPVLQTVLAGCERGRRDVWR